jgi:hypothetical protein
LNLFRDLFTCCELQILFVIVAGDPKLAGYITLLLLLLLFCRSEPSVSFSEANNLCT